MIKRLEGFGCQVIPYLLKEFTNKDSHMRWEAAAVLGRLGATEISPVLLKVIQEEEMYDRWEAIKVLKDLGRVEEIMGL
ncbi:hypothetical protein C7B65_26370 [Phormidesmis priestleyi ULC007]|uniref:HEAT repeat domain-containing protein n=1 Tax=Phormidesmis priestleyi ULC007 TaxID=1920490 RepID=A0A2T1D1U3_9CYAN|nr:HEAT repeat domain-containing protein [Phormidesmis priestleyi]PSB14472.1 hypothetical protein C7B65_26370 [Phormidesmis priestleyi ULC007]